MQLTKREIEVIKALHNSELGNGLIDYLKRLQDWSCDIRNKEIKDENARIALVDMIQLYLIDKISIQNKDKDIVINEFE